MIRRKKTTIFLDAKENTKVSDLKRMIEGITKKPPAEQRLYNKEDVSQLMDSHYSLFDYGITKENACAQDPAPIGLAYMEAGIGTGGEGMFEDLEITPYSSPPELPAVMKTEKETAKKDDKSGGNSPGSSASSSRPGSSAGSNRPDSGAGSSRPGSSAGSNRPDSGAGSSRPGSRADSSRPGSRADSSRPDSNTGTSPSANS